MGLDALATTWTRFLAAWKDATMTAEEIREASNSVVVAICFRAKGHETGLPFDDRYGHLWTFRGNKAIRLELFPSFAEALEAVGLRE